MTSSLTNCNFWQLLLVTGKRYQLLFLFTIVTSDQLNVLIVTFDNFFWPVTSDFWLLSFWPVSSNVLSCDFWHGDNSQHVCFFRYAFVCLLYFVWCTCFLCVHMHLLVSFNQRFENIVLRRKNSQLNQFSTCMAHFVRARLVRTCKIA